MYTVAIEKTLDVICELLTNKWYGYDTNTFLRDNFMNDVMSYNYIVNSKWLEYLYIHMNIETETNIIPMCEFYSDSIEIVNKEMEKYDDNYIIDEIIDLRNNRYGFIVSEISCTIEKITCDYSYLCNFQYDDIFE